MPDLTPITREEMFLDGNTELTPITREEMILAGEDIDVITRREWFLKKYRGSGGEIVLEDITITENGVVTAPSGKAYKKITTDVPLPENAYLLKDIPNTPCDIATFTDGSSLPMPSLKTTIVPIQSGSGDPSPSNVRPISGWTEGNVSVCGVNVWNEEIEHGTIDNSTGALVNDNSLYRSKHKIFVKGGISLYFKSNYGMMVYQYREDNSFIKYTDNIGTSYKTLTMEQDTSYIRVRFFSNLSSADLLECSMNYPSTDTSYHAYNGHTYTIPFTDAQGNPITVYGGECDVVNGTSGNVNTHKTIVMSDLTWSYSDSLGLFYTSLTDYKKLSTTTIPYAWCEVFKVVGRNTVLTDGQDGITFGNVSEYDNRILVRASNIADLTTFNNIIDGKKLCYELATPSTFTSQPTSIKSIEGENNVWADCGQIKEGSYFSQSEEE